MLLLAHSISEVEKAALLHDYQPFYYQMDSRLVYFTASACKTLRENTEQRLALVRHRIHIEEKSGNIPPHLREVFEDPCEVLSLPTYARVNLHKVECYTLLRIMLAGRQYFVNQPKFGRKTMKQINELFARHGCSWLFK
jgi:uncharacterized protein YcgL (UPF0745 family)